MAGGLVGGYSVGKGVGRANIRPNPDYCQHV